MENYDIRILNTKSLIKNADYVIIGAGAGLSTASGLMYSGESFYKNYKEFIEKYNFQDLYTATFYPFKTETEKWAFWAKMINLNRFNKPLKLYQELLKLVKNKEYFVLTTNADGQFEIAGFEKDRIFATQGDYKFLQCKNACHNSLYDDEEMVKDWLKYTEELEIPEDLVPKCPVCGVYMEMNLRKDSNFVQDNKWYEQSDKYEQFLERTKGKNLVLLEIGARI